jgi:uncharacterized protein (DUF1499 family)
MTQGKGGYRAVRWIRRLALLALLALPLSVIVVRLGWWQPGLLVYALACLLSAALLALSVILTLLPSLRGPQRGSLLQAALLALPGSVLLATLLAGRGDYPPIHDISTDLEQPPNFSHAPSLRGSDANPLTVKPETLAVQREAYPDIRPLKTPLPTEAAYRRALETARALGWEVVYEAPRDGEIEAVVTTPIMGFRDDVMIRLRAADGGTRVDLRSVSRVGLGDLGANAERIRAFIDRFNAAEE